MTTEENKKISKGLRIFTPRKTILAIVALLVFIVGIAFYFTPYWTIHKMKRAAINKDSDAFSEYVDYPSLRESFKAMLNASMASEMATDLSGNPFEALGAALAAAMVNKIVDAYVTPESLAMMMRGEKIQMNKSGEIKKSSSKKANIKTQGSYKSFNRFGLRAKEIDSSEKIVDLIFKRDGIISWKLYAMRFPSKEEKKITTASSAKLTVSESQSGEKEKKPKISEKSLDIAALKNQRIQRFIDNGDGTVTDNSTKLIWSKNAQQLPGEMNWFDAVNECKNLVFAGL